MYEYVYECTTIKFVRTAGLKSRDPQYRRRRSRRQRVRSIPEVLRFIQKSWNL